MNQTRTTARRHYLSMQCIHCHAKIEFEPPVPAAEMHAMLRQIYEINERLGCEISPVCTACADKLNLGVLIIPERN